LRKSKAKLLAAGAAVLALAAPLFAHDFWIEPSTFRPEVGATVGLSLRVGQGFRGDPVPLQPDKVVKFVTVSPSGAETSATGVPGRDPAGRGRITEPGYVLVAYRSNPSSLELPADKFEAYLKEEGLEKIIEARAKRGDSATNFQLLPGDRLYVKAAPIVTASTWLDRAIHPVERVLGVTLLGASTIQTVEGRNLSGR